MHIVKATERLCAFRHRDGSKGVTGVLTDTADAATEAGTRVLQHRRQLGRSYRHCRREKTDNVFILFKQG